MRQICFITSSIKTAAIIPAHHPHSYLSTQIHLYTTYNRTHIPKSVSILKHNMNKQIYRLCEHNETDRTPCKSNLLANCLIHIVSVIFPLNFIVKLNTQYLQNRSHSIPSNKTANRQSFNIAVNWCVIHGLLIG